MPLLSLLSNSLSKKYVLSMEAMTWCGDVTAPFVPWSSAFRYSSVIA